jgi:hypothetical protein
MSIGNLRMVALSHYSLSQWEGDGQVAKELFAKYNFTKK